MKNRIIFLIAILIVIVSSGKNFADNLPNNCSFLFATTKSCETKYVMGGLSDPGDGTPMRPYNSLALAEADTSWNKLVVLASAVPLDGGITMRAGTTLTGEKNPVDGPFTINQSMITNSSASSNGGNGIVCGKSVTIEDIYIKDTWGSGIRYDNADYLHVSNVRISGHNRGKVSSMFEMFTQFHDYKAAAIHGQSNSNGRVTIEKSIVSDNHCGMGLLDIAYNQSKREIFLQDCVFEKMNSTNALNNSTVEIAAYGMHTSQKVTLEFCNLQGYFLNSDPESKVYGIKILSQDGAKQNIHINDCEFSNLSGHNYDRMVADDFTNNTCAILLQSLTFGDGVSPKERSTQKANINGCTFSEPLVFSKFKTNTSIGIQKETRQGVSKLKVKSNTFTNVDTCVLCIVDGNATDTYKITYNNATGPDSFYTILSETHPESYGPPNFNTTVNLVKNDYRGGDNFGAFCLVSSFNSAEVGQDAPWAHLKATLENNIFNGGFHNGPSGLLAVDFGNSGAGNVEISGKKNSIINWIHHIADLGAGVHYSFEKNWWGEGSVNNYNNGSAEINIKDSRSQHPRNHTVWTYPHGFDSVNIKIPKLGSFDQTTVALIKESFLKRNNSSVFTGWPRSFINKNNNFFEYNWVTLEGAEVSDLKEIFLKTCAEIYNHSVCQMDSYLREFQGKFEENFDKFLLPRLLDETALVLVAKQDGKPVGFAVYDKVNHDEVHIIALVVDPHHRHYNLGKQFVNFLLVKEPDVEKLLAVSEKQNKEAARFYHALGFHDSGCMVSGFDSDKFNVYAKKVMSSNIKSQREEDLWTFE